MYLIKAMHFVFWKVTCDERQKKKKACIYYFLLASCIINKAATKENFFGTIQAPNIKR